MLKITIEIDDKQNVTVNTTDSKAVKPQAQQQTPVRKDGKKHGTVESRNCEGCGQAFKPTSNVQKYCSIGCRLAKVTQSTNKEITQAQIERSKDKPFSNY